MKALAWIIGIVIVIAIIYFVLNARKKAALANTGQVPGTTGIFGSGSGSAPVIQAPCLNDPIIQNQITAYPTLSSFLKPLAKQAILQKCPQAANLI